MYSSLRSFVTYLGIGAGLVIILYGGMNIFSSNTPRESINQAVRSQYAAQYAAEYGAEYASQPRRPTTRTYQPVEQAPPSNGWSQIYRASPNGSSRRSSGGSRAPIAPFRIITGPGNHYYLKLLDAYDLSLVMTVFVRSHNIVDVKVPVGTYRVRYASGKTWYGERDLFGEDTEYGEFDTFFRFDTSGSDIMGFSLTIGDGKKGNLARSNIRPEGF